jgi:methionyl-tRNA synthetase
MESIGELEAEADDHVEHLRFSRALESICNVIQLSDQYIDKTAPWTLAKKPENRERLENALFHIANTLGSLIQFVYPFMPKTAENLAQQLGLEPGYDGKLFRYKDPALLPGRSVTKSPALFPRIDTKQLQGAKTVSDPTTPPQPPLPSAPTGPPSQTTTASPTTGAPQAPAPINQITIDDFMKIQLKTAKIVIAERVPKSDKLIKLIVNLGNEQRQIVAGIGKKYEPADLVGKSIVIVANLKPAKLMGIESQGMVLAAGDKEVNGLVTILEEVEPGTKVK